MACIKDCTELSFEVAVILIKFDILMFHSQILYKINYINRNDRTIIYVKTVSQKYKFDDASSILKCD